MSDRPRSVGVDLPVGGPVWDGLDGLGRAMLEASPLPIIAIDNDQVVRVANPAALRLFGRPGAELLGTPVGSLLRPDDAEATLARIVDAADEQRGHLEFEVVVPGGRTIPVGMSFAALAHEGQRIGMLAVGRDITARRAAEHEARQLAASFQALAESSDVGMYRFSFHPELRVDHVNPAFARALGYSFEELAVDASPLETNIAPEDARRLVANRRSPDPRWPVEFDWSRPDGTSLVFSVTEVPLRSPDGELRAVLGIARDVTAEQHAREALTESLEAERVVGDRLRRVDELRRLSLQAVSHELRTPLTVVAGFAATLRDHLDELDDREIVDFSTRLHVQTTKMQSLLDDLLDIERTSRGMTSLVLEPLDVSEVVRAAVRDEGGPTVRFTGSPATAHVDRIKLERIVANLLSNAHRHAGLDANVHVGVSIVEGRVRLTVDDDGPGIAEDLRQRVFEAFEQGSTASGAASPGTGIGLTLVREFTRLHHGTVVVETSELGGARFVVDLPVAGAAGGMEHGAGGMEHEAGERSGDRGHR